MIIDVDTASAVPAFEQVRAQIAAMIASGVLAPGHRLPSIRQLAADLGLAPGTVARVYRELESTGLVSSRVRHGTVVAPGRQQPAAEAHEHLLAAARAYAASARRLGLPLDDAVSALRSGWDGLPDL